ncbi:MAG: GGDEF domain-containing protein [Tissierellales bacterium]|nr:GGDEF domain-containing protein [Tissierellales bacterium]MBN2828653.1 GGDEF domain-containing protein [Tissierellales bacterium]
MEAENIFQLKEEILDQIPVGLCQCQLVMNADDVEDIKFIWINQFMQEIIGFQKSEISNKTLTVLFPNVKASIFDWVKIFSEAAFGGYKHIEQFVDMFGRYLSIDVSGLDDGKFYMVMNDITDKREFRRILLEKDSEIAYINNEMRKKANLDTLTMAYNYQFIMKILKEESEYAKNKGRRLSAALLDIDDFTLINNENGTEIGDRVLEETGIALRNSVRKIDSIGRTGGDEFLLIMTNVDIDIAKIVIERIKMQMNIDIKSLENLKVTLSGAVLEYEDEHFEEFYQKLRNKLIKAKSLGKNMIIF